MPWPNKDRLCSSRLRLGITAKCPGMPASQPTWHLREKRGFRIILILPAKDGSLCVLPTHWPGNRRRPHEGVRTRMDGAPRTPSLDSCRGCLCAQPKTLSTTRPSVAPGSLRPQSQISPAINKGKEAVCPPTLQNKAVRAGYRQPPPCQAQTHKV